ncbi:transcription elongation regulator, partial [Coemansia spiralis]
LPPEVLAGSGHDWAVFLAPLDARNRQHMPEERYYYERNNGITTWTRPFDYVEPTDSPSAALEIGDRWRREEAEKKRLQARQLAKQDRPARQAAVGDTEWRRVDTVQGRVYYYNTATRTSQWEQPAELAEELQAMDRAPADPEPEGTEMTEEDAEWMLAQMEQEGAGTLDAISEEAASDDEQPAAVLPKSECIAQFKEMLLECKLDPFGAWDIERDKLAGDPRFAALDDDEERQNLFDDACRIILEQRRSQKKQEDAAGSSDPFGQLLAEKVTKKVSFAKFCHRNINDPRYLAIKTSREREKRFTQHLDSLL